MKNKIINFTPTGTQTTKENSLAPLFPAEIIEEVHQAFELGISLTHIHARDPKDLSNTYRKDVYSDIISGIRTHCPGLCICVSLTGRSYKEFENRSEVLELYPDMGSLTMSSLNFPNGPSVNEPEMILRLIEKMDKYGVIPEIECFDSGMLNYTNYLINKGVLSGPHYINVILGNIYNAQTDLSTISSILYNKPVHSVMCLGGIGTYQLHSNLMGLLYFDGVRVGLEDNFHYRGKELGTNIALLKRIHRVIEELDFGVVSSNEFKDLGYGNKKINHIR
ncbi:MAG: 3-keto-5-aminohexanoate cleavage protein [Saprospiraceae bacterium]